MAGQELKVAFVVDDQGSLKIENIKKTIQSTTDSVQSMGKALEVIKWDAVANLAQKALGVFQQFHGLATLGAMTKSVEDSFLAMSQNAGIAGDTLIQKLKQVTGETVADSELMKKSNRMIIEGFSANQIVQVGEAARMAARIMRTDVATAYDEVADAIVNLRERGLKTAGFVIDLNEAYVKHAATLGITSKELSQYGKQMALVEALNAKRIEMLREMAPLETNEFENIQKQTRAWTELKEVVGGMALRAWQNLTEEAGKMFFIIKSAVDLVKSIPGIKDTTVEGPESEVELAAKRAKAAAKLKKPSEKVVDPYLELWGMTKDEMMGGLLIAAEEQRRLIAELQYSTLEKAFKDVETQMALGHLTEQLIPLHPVVSEKDLAVIAEYPDKLQSLINSARKEYADLIGDTQTLILLDKAEEDAAVKRLQREIGLEPILEEAIRKTGEQRRIQMTDSAKFFTDVGTQFADQWSNSLAKVLTGQAKFGEAMKSMWTDLVTHIIQQLLRIQVMNALFGNTEGKGGLFNSTSGIAKGIGAIGNLFSSSPSLPAVTSPSYFSYAGMFQEGTNYVPQTGLALLHKGEAVIPAEMNRGSTEDRAPVVNNYTNYFGVTDAEGYRRMALQNKDLHQGMALAAFEEGRRRNLKNFRKN